MNIDRSSEILITCGNRISVFKRAIKELSDVHISQFLKKDSLWVSNNEVVAQSAHNVCFDPNKDGDFKLREFKIDESGWLIKPKLTYFIPIINIETSRSIHVQNVIKPSGLKNLYGITMESVCIDQEYYVLISSIHTMKLYPTTPLGVVRYTTY